MNYWDSVGRWINTLLLFIVGVIGFDTLFRMLQAREANVIVSVTRVLSTIVLIPFQGMFSEQDYLLTAAMGVLGYAVLAGIVLTVLRSIQATRVPRDSYAVPQQHQPVRPAGGTDSAVSQQRSARRSRPQANASQRPASQRPVERASTQATASSRAGGQRKPAQRVDGQRTAPERADTERSTAQRPAAARPDAQPPRQRRTAARPQATPTPPPEGGNHNGRMAKPQSTTDAPRAPNAEANASDVTATPPAGARTERKARGKAPPPEPDNSSNERSDTA